MNAEKKEALAELFERAIEEFIVRAHDELHLPMDLLQYIEDGVLDARMRIIALEED